MTALRLAISIGLGMVSLGAFAQDGFFNKWENRVRSTVARNRRGLFLCLRRPPTSRSCFVTMLYVRSHLPERTRGTTVLAGLQSHSLV